MGHINREPGENDITASIYVVRVDGPEPRLVMHNHKLIKKFLQFGGHVEPDQNLWQAAVIELDQESGYTVDQLKVLQPAIRIKSMDGVVMHPIPLNPVTHPFPGIDHFHTDIAFAVMTDEPPRHEINEGESKEVVLLTADELRALPSEQIPDNVRTIGLFVLEEVIGGWEPVDASEFALQ